jgi:AraC-like DNA-binding protein
VSSPEAVQRWGRSAAGSDRIHRALQARIGERQDELDRIVTAAQRLIPSCTVAELVTSEDRSLRVLARSADVPPPPRRTVLDSETAATPDAPLLHVAPHLSLASLPPPVWATLGVAAHPPIALVVHAPEPVWDTARGAAALALVRRLSVARIVHLAVSDDLQKVRAATERNRGLAAAVEIICDELSIDRRDAFAVLRQLAAMHRTKLQVTARRIVDAGSTRVLRVVEPSREPTSMGRALTYIEKHLDADLSIDEIAAAAGVTPRALQASFRAYRDTTPMAYARDLRLERAHRDLLSAGPGAGRSVAEIAKSHGFHNPGRFADAYRRRFGRTPRQTLQVWAPAP